MSSYTLRLILKQRFGIINVLNFQVVHAKSPLIHTRRKRIWCEKSTQLNVNRFKQIGMATLKNAMPIFRVIRLKSKANLNAQFTQLAAHVVKGKIYHGSVGYPRLLHLGLHDILHELDANHRGANGHAQRVVGVPQPSQHALV